MSSRMERKKQQNRKLILDAAEKLISEKGISKITMEKVAQKADLATGTLYLYFKQKDCRRSHFPYWFRWWLYQRYHYPSCHNRNGLWRLRRKWHGFLSWQNRI